jgi:AmiR/NasT family two-component response regulator
MEAGAPGGLLRVLVAEDDFLVALQIKQAVEAHGHEVVAIAKNGTDAVAMCRAYHPDVVLMDIGMPGMDGLEATRLIMAEAPTCVVVVTAKPDARVAAEQAGAMAYAVKPLLADRIPSLFAVACRRFARLRSPDAQA